MSDDYGNVVDACCAVESELATKWPRWGVKAGGTAYVPMTEQYMALFVCTGLAHWLDLSPVCSETVELSPDVVDLLGSGIYHSDMLAEFVRNVEDRILDRIEEGEWVYRDPVV